MNKKMWRAHLRAIHGGKAERDRQSASMCQQILSSSAYQNARVLGGYMPLPWEADILPVLQDAVHQGKTLVLPRCGQAPCMTLRRVTALEELILGAFGLAEPAENTECVPLSRVDLLLVPLEGIDREGFRLGKGGGYYDCLLQDSAVTTMGCALTWQWTDCLPREPWDKPLSACADEFGVHWFPKE